jgi:hypothetical protein
MLRLRILLLLLVAAAAAAAAIASVAVPIARATVLVLIGLLRRVVVSAEPSLVLGGEDRNRGTGKECKSQEPTHNLFLH